MESKLFIEFSSMAYSEQDTKNTTKYSFHPLQFAFWAMIMILAITLIASIATKPTPHKKLIRLQPLPHITHALLEHSPWQKFTVQPGDNLIKIFHRANIDDPTYYAILQLDAVKQTLTSLLPGESIYFAFDQKHQLEHMAYKADLTTYLYVTRSGDHFEPHLLKQKLTKALITAGGTIHQSFALAAQKANLPPSVSVQLSHVFSWDIDFSKQIHSGDLFKIIYEEYVADGKNVKPGNIIAAELINRHTIYKAIRYQVGDHPASYYTAEGKNLKRTFLRFPVKFKRISSAFNTRRLDPILHIVRPHLGVDLAAPMGTPIHASADGHIAFRGRMGGYGKLVIVQHNRTYSTRYAHMSRFANGQHKDSYVKQGQIIGYVGQTGFATGPHLHYEVRINGIAHNPVTVTLPSGSPIPSRERDAFLLYAHKISTELDHITIT